MRAAFFACVLLLVAVLLTATAKAGVTRTVIAIGSGLQPVKGDKVTVHATGYITELKKKFWSTKDKDEPFSFFVGKGNVIRGWDEGVLQMREGETAELSISSDYAYGAGGFPAWGIAPHTALTFEIELLQVTKKK